MKMFNNYFSFSYLKKIFFPLFPISFLNILSYPLFLFLLIKLFFCLSAHLKYVHQYHKRSKLNEKENESGKCV